jgi:type I restriction enzyme, S subunit
MSNAGQGPEVPHVRRYKAYPAYKSSGVEWLGNVPQDWHVDRLKWSTQGMVNGTWGDEPNGADDIICVRVADFDRERFLVVDEPPTWRAVEPSQRERRLLRKRDLLIEKSGGGEKQLVGCVVLFDHDYSAVCSNFVARMPVASGMHPRFWCYVHAALYASRLNYPSIKQTTGIQNLDGSAYLNERVGFPNFDEQRKIADFLDREMAKIDRLIERKRALTEKLKEKRFALISRTVTRGLPPDAARAAGLNPRPPMKPSGIDWFEEVPASWRTSRIKYVARIESGHTPSRSVDEYWIDCNIPWVSLNDSGYLREHDYISDTVYQINELGLANSSARLLPAGAVVFSRDATVGLCAITTRPMAVSQHFVAYLCGPRLVPKYLLLTLKAMNQHLERLSLGATIQTIGMTDVRSLACAIPPVVEQEAIVAFLDRETERIDVLVGRIEEAIDRLREYRTALISAAVTGKIDVRGVA